MPTMTRRSFLKAAGATAIPLVAGMPRFARGDPDPDPWRKHKLLSFNRQQTGGDYEYLSYAWDLARDIAYRFRPDPTATHHRARKAIMRLNLAGGSSFVFTRIHVDGNSMRWSDPYVMQDRRPGDPEHGILTLLTVDQDMRKVPPDFRNVTIVYVPRDPNEAPTPDGLKKRRGDLVVTLNNGKAYTDSEYYRPSDNRPSECFLTTACTSARGLPDDCMELQTLRAFRDGYMKTEASEGQAMIREYYLTAPAVVSAINARKDATEIHDWMYRDLVLPSVRLIQRGQNATAIDHYAAFFQSLRDETLHGVNPFREAQCIS